MFSVRWINAANIPGRSCNGVGVRILGAGQDETPYRGCRLSQWGGEASLLFFTFWCSSV